jgi:hypothetical protein
MSKNCSSELVRSVLNIPIYVPKPGVASDNYTLSDKTHDVRTLKTYLLRGEKLQEFRGQDATLARTINATCIFIYLCEHPNLLKHHTNFREVVRNKRTDLMESLKDYRNDVAFMKACNIFDRVCSIICSIISSMK